jgi:hypothetical protein
MNNLLYSCFYTVTLFLGFSDPFVKVRLLPKEKFQHVSKPSTAVQKKTLYPLFDECFKMLIFYYNLLQRIR